VEFFGLFCSIRAVRTLSLLAFCALFGISALGVFLADRLVRTRGQAYLRSYTLHLAFWNGHALLQFMQIVLGAEFLPETSWAALGSIMAPLVGLMAATSLYFLVLFASQAAGSRLPRLFLALYALLWAGLTIFFALIAGDGAPGPGGRSMMIYSLAFFVLKTATVLGAMAYLLHAASGSGDSGEKRALRAVAWAYVLGFLLFQFSVSGLIPIGRLPGHDYLITSIQIGFHFPVLAALGLYARRRAAARTGGPLPVDAPGGPSGKGLSPREAEIVGLVMLGLSNKEIEARLFISLETVKKHLSSIYRKLGVKNRLQLSLLMQKRPEASRVY
jgi:DNA-binding CsgD family transcriptional regulator